MDRLSPVTLWMTYSVFLLYIMLFWELRLTVKLKLMHSLGGGAFSVALDTSVGPPIRHVPPISSKLESRRNFYNLLKKNIIALDKSN